MNFRLALNHRCLGVVCASILTACQPVPSLENLPGDLARATGTAAMMEFRTEGLPLDGPQQVAVTLTLQEAVQTSLLNSAELQEALAKVHVATAEAQQTRLLPNPLLSVVLRWPEGGGSPIVEAGLAADLLSLVQRPRQAGAADHRIRSTAADALRTALDVVAAVQERFANVQAAEAQLQVLQQRRTTLESIVAIAEARQRLGEGTRLDVLTLAAQRAELETEIMEKESERRDERLALARLLGLPSSDATWSLAPLLTPVVSGEEAQWIAAALHHRPEIQARRWELAALGDEAALARYSFWEGTLGVHAERDASWSVGPALDLPLPLFDWGQARQALAQARVVEARQRLIQATRQTVEDVRRASAALAARRQALEKVETGLIPLQQQRLAQAQAQYRNGLTDVTAVLLAEQDAQASRAKLVALQQSLAIATFRLQRAAGGPGIPPSAPAATRVAVPPSSHPEKPL